MSRSILTGKVGKVAKLLLAVTLLIMAAALMHRSWDEIMSLRPAGQAATWRHQPEAAAPMPEEPDRIMRARRAELPEVPRVALLDLYVDGGSWGENRAAANYTNALQMSLLKAHGIRWVERQNLRPLEQELDLLSVMPDDPAAALRVGKWAAADLVVRGALVEPGKPQQRLRFEVIDLASADVAARRELPVSGYADGDAFSAEVMEMSAALIGEALAEAQQGLRAQMEAEIATAAVLFFKNTGRTDRLDFLEWQIVQAFVEQASGRRGLRLLRLPSADTSVREVELAILGLTEADPDAWQHAADVYIWGSFSELEAEENRELPFDEVEVELTVNLWNGMGEVEVVSERARVGVLPEAVGAAVERVLTISEDHRSETVSLKARNEVVKLLLDRAAEIGRIVNTTRRTDPTFTRHGWGADIQDYQIHLVEMASFFAPEVAEVRRAQHEARWGQTWASAPDALGHVWARLDAEQRYVRLFGWVAPHRTRDGGVRWDTWAIERHGHGLRQAMDLLSRSQRNAPMHQQVPEDMRRRLRNEVLGRIAEYAVASREAAKELEAARARGEAVPMAVPPAQLVVELLSRVFDVPGDADVTARAVEALWPLYKPAYERNVRAGVQVSRPRNVEQRLYDVLSAVGREGNVHEMLTMKDASKEAAEGRSAVGEEARARQPAPIRPRSFADISPPRRQSNENEMERLEVPAELARLRPVMRWVDLRNAFDGRYHMSQPDNVFRITDMESVGERLWISADYSRDGLGHGVPILLMYEPATDTLVNVTEHLPPHSRIVSLTGGEGELWLATERDGVWRMDAESFDHTAFGGEAGLLSRESRDIVRLGARVVVASTARRLSVLEPGAEQFADLDVRSEATGGRAAVTLAPVAAHRDWLVVGSPPHIVNLPSGEARSLQEMVEARFSRQVVGARGHEPNLVSQASIAAAAADDAAIWLVVQRLAAGESHLVRYEPDANAVKRWPLPMEADWVLALDGELIWLACSEEVPGLGHTEMPAVHVRSYLMVFHAGRERFMGVFSVPGHVQRMIAVGGRMWIGLDRSIDSLVEVDAQSLLQQAGTERELPKAQVMTDAAIAQHTGATPLMRASYSGDIETVRELLNGSADARAATPTGWTALMSAAAGGDPEIVRLLLEHGAEVEHRQSRRPEARAMHVAARHGHVEAMRVLLEAGAMIDQQSAAGTPLMLAAGSGRAEAVQLLLERGAQMEVPVTRLQDERGNALTPLARAAELGYHEIVKLLLAEGGEPVRQSSGLPLAVAISRGDVEMLRLLLEAGADPQDVSAGGRTALALAATLQAGPSQAQQMIDLLLSHGADPNRGGRMGPPLMLLSQSGSVELMRRLIEAGVDVNVLHTTNVSEGSPPRRYVRYDTPFIVAAATGNGPAMVLLLDAGADLDLDLEGAKQGELAMIRAARGERADVVRLLLGRGIEVNASDHTGRTALHYAAERGAQRVAQVLVDAGADGSIRCHERKRAVDLARGEDMRRMLAEQMGMTDTVARAAQTDAPARITPWLATRMLIEAVREGDRERAAQAVEMGADVNARDEEWPCLVLAGRQGDVEMIEMLLKARGDVNAQGPAGWTALMQAAANGHGDAVIALLRGGADPDLRNSVGRTAQGLASQRGHEAVVRILVGEQDRR
jgi:uncharacterized protein